MSRHRITTFVTALSVVSGIRAAWLVFAQLYGLGGVQRPHVESGVLAFVLLIAIRTLLIPHDASESEQRTDSDSIGPRTAALSLAWGAAWCAAALALYWRTLYIGPLSDDFVLLERARQWQIGMVHTELFRPLPLLIWALWLPVIGPTGLHVVNVLLHGIVAYLTQLLAAPVVRSRSTAALTGLLVLVFPSAVEPVAWLSGIFDVSSTALALSAILLARLYEHHDATLARIAMLAAALGAFFSKETAVVTPVLIALDVWMRGGRLRRLLPDISGLVVVFSVLGLWRWSMASALVRRPLSRFMIQRWSFGSLAGLTEPWHEVIFQQTRWMVAVYAILVLLLAAMAIVAPVRNRQIRAASVGAVWILLGTAPTLTFFFVSPLLEGSRYLYLSSVGFALALASLANVSTRLRRAGHIALIALVVCGVTGARVHQGFWQAAGVERDEVIQSASVNPTIRNCPEVALLDLPDNHRGAYVLRNGVAEAFAQVSIEVTHNAPSDCIFRWRPDTESWQPR